MRRRSQSPQTSIAPPLAPMESIRWMIPSKPPPLKTFMLPIIMVGAMAPNMNKSGWAWTILMMLLATWVGSLVTEKIENSEWRQQLAKDAEEAHQRIERENEAKQQKKEKKEKNAAPKTGSSKKKD